MISISGLNIRTIKELKNKKVNNKIRKLIEDCLYIDTMERQFPHDLFEYIENIKRRSIELMLLNDFDSVNSKELEYQIF